MEFLQLKYFCLTAETENMSRTASYFMVPPSSVSATIAKLEAEIGVKLFDRTRNRITLNEDGRAFYTAARYFMSGLDDAVEKLRAKDGADRSRVNVLTYMRMYEINHMGIAFTKLHPEIAINMSFYKYGDRGEKDYNLIIAFEPPMTVNMDSLQLGKYYTCVLISRENPLSHNTEVSAADLRDEKFYVLDYDTPMWRRIEAACKNAGFTPTISVEVGTATPMLYAENNLAVGFVLVPGYIRPEEGCTDRFVCLPLTDDNWDLTLTCYHKPEIMLSKSEQTFLDFLKTYQISGFFNSK